MPLRRTRNAGTAPSKEQLGREMRQSRLVLFIQQVEKEGQGATEHHTSSHLPSPVLTTPEHVPLTAQERMNDLEAKMENTLATMDKVFKVEVMKMPPSLQSALIGDLISGEPSASTHSDH